MNTSGLATGAHIVPPTERAERINTSGSQSVPHGGGHWHGLAMARRTSNIPDMRGESRAAMTMGAVRTIAACLVSGRPMNSKDINIISGTSNFSSRRWNVHGGECRRFPGTHLSSLGGQRIAWRNIALLACIGH